MTEFEQFALDLAQVAAGASLPFFRQVFETDNKLGDRGFDPVTEADRAAERALRAAIAERYPHHGVIGEEYGEDRPDADHVWILDPIDGTRAFVAGLPLWTSLIALRIEGRPRVGAIGQPYLGEVFLGGPSGAWLIRDQARRALRTRSCDHLNAAVISTTDPDILSPSEGAAWAQVRAAARLTRLGCDAYAYAMVAAGHMDLVAETGLKPWDWSALVPLIEAAGGRVTDWAGRTPDGNGQILAVGDARLTDQALVALRRASRPP